MATTTFTVVFKQDTFHVFLRIRNDKEMATGKENLGKALNILDAHLLKHTFLVITLCRSTCLVHFHSKNF